MPDTPRSSRPRFTSLWSRLFDRRRDSRPRPVRLGLEALEERAVPASYSIRLLSPGAGDLGETAASHAGGFSLAAGPRAANGALIVQADTAADAARLALAGTVSVTFQEQFADYPVSPGAIGGTAADHLPFLLTQPDQGQSALWRMALEDLTAEHMQPLGVDWDYDDRSWELDVRPYQPPLIGEGTGLLGRVFAEQDLAGLTALRVDPLVDFRWGDSAPADNTPADHFSVRWTGQVQPRYSDWYTLYTTSDDGVRLWLDDQVVIDNWTDHGPTTNHTVPLLLSAGQLYTIRMEYYENGGGATAQLGWVSAYYQPEEIIPTSQLYPELLPVYSDGSGNGLLGVYHAGSSLSSPVAVARIDPTVGFDWGGGSPGDGLSNDGFAVAWSGQVQPRYSGDYRFYTRSDDGVRLWLNGQLLIDNWTDHGTTTDRSAALPLLAGQLYDIRMAYYENAGGAMAQLLWSSDNQLKEVIPTSQLHADPFAQADAYTIGHDTVLEVTAAGVLANDIGSGLQAVLTSEPGHGTVALAADGSFTYTPVPGFVGTDTFRYQVLQGGRSSEAAQVSIVLTDDAPDAGEDRYSVHPGASTVVSVEDGVLVNDFDPDGDELSAVLVEAPQYGTLILQPDGSFVYTPAEGFAGSDSFRYTAVAGALVSNEATVTLVVRPVGVDDWYTLAHDSELSVEADWGVLSNDRNGLGTPLTVTVTTGPAHGTLIMSADGGFLYRPADGYVGPDGFSYVATSEAGQSELTAVYLEVTNTAPQTGDAWYQTEVGQALVESEIGLAAFASDPDPEDHLTFVIVSGPEHGTFTEFNADGTFSYLPTAGFVGTDQFTYRVSDGAADSPQIGTVFIAVTGHHAPIALPADFQVARDGALAADESRNLVRDSAYDLDADELSAALVQPPGHAAAFVLYDDGRFSYTPQPGFAGIDTFQFQVTDGTVSSNAATVTLTVTGLPIAREDVYLFGEDGSVGVPGYRGVLRNDFLLPGAVLFAQLLQEPAYGTVVLDADGGFQYTPDPAHPVSDEVTFEYMLVDAQGVPPGGQPVAPGVRALVHLIWQALLPTFTVIEETFNEVATAPAGSPKTVLAVSKDDGSGLYPTGWRSGEAANAVAFVPNALFSGVTRFSISDPRNLLPLLKDELGVVSGTNLLGVFELPQEIRVAVDVTGRALTATWSNARTNETAFVRDAGLPWEIRVGEANGPPLTFLNATNAGQNRLYVLAGRPVAGTTLFHTVVRVGTLEAEQSAGTTNLLKQRLIDRFKTLRIEAADSGKVLTYYGKWTAADPKLTLNTTALLLKHGDGMCDSWARFFIDILGAQGLSAGVSRYAWAPIAKYGEFMFVKTWEQTPGARLVNTYARSFIDFQGNRYVWRTANVVKKLDSIPGQGNMNPLAVFENHVVVELKFDYGDTAQPETVLFDPSYGMSYSGATDAARRLAMQNSSLSYLGMSGVVLPIQNSNNPVRYVKFITISTSSPLYIRRLARV